MRDRLIELLRTSPTLDVIKDEFEEWEIAADYLLANGVIVSPCKVGDWVYMLKNGEIHRNHVCQIHISQTHAQTFFSCYGEKFGIEQIGKTVFLTRELAEEALNEQKKL